MNITTWILVTLCCDINIGILAYIWLFEIKKRTSKVDSHRQSVDLENPHQGSSNTKELDRNDNSDNRHENSKSCFTGLVSTLKGKVALIIVLSLIYMLEIKDTIPTKTLERDTTGPLILIMVQLLIIGLVTTRMVSKNQQYKFLNRDQSDEWKGLMQVFIILAHYFRLYSYCAARVSVACYVWMTGTTGDTTKKKNKNNNKTIISTEDLDSSTKNLFKLKNEFLSLELFLLLLFSGALLLYWVFWCARRYEPEEFASYMDSHCYSSLLFIAGYLLLRNLTPTLRILGLTAQCAFYAHNELSFFLFSSGDRFQYL
eukprot:Awhi_evm1s378